jgi:hypothetical protein
MPEEQPAVPPIALQLGADRQNGVVVLKMGGFVQTVNSATARAYAIGLIHAAEIAGLPKIEEDEKIGLTE